ASSARARRSRARGAQTAVRRPRAARRRGQDPPCNRRSSSDRHYRKELGAAFGGRHIDHRAAVVFLARGERDTGGSTRVNHAPLDLAAVLRARDDFLAGIAGLAEVDAADRLEVLIMLNAP